MSRSLCGSVFLWIVSFPKDKQKHLMPESHASWYVEAHSQDRFSLHHVGSLTWTLAIPSSTEPSHKVLGCVFVLDIVRIVSCGPFLPGLLWARRQIFDNRTWLHSPGWPWTHSFLFASVSQSARTAGVSHNIWVIFDFVIFVILKTFSVVYDILYNNFNLIKM